VAGETHLQTLLGQLNPSMRPEFYVFCTLKNGRYGDMAHTQPLASFLESEGLTLVMTQAQADEEGSLSRHLSLHQPARSLKPRGRRTHGHCRQCLG
jgi:hypothetical protein